MINPCKYNLYAHGFLKPFSPFSLLLLLPMDVPQEIQRRGWGRTVGRGAACRAERSARMVGVHFHAEAQRRQAAQREAQVPERGQRDTRWDFCWTVNVSAHGIQIHISCTLRSHTFTNYQEKLNFHSLLIFCGCKLFLNGMGHDSGTQCTLPCFLPEFTGECPVRKCSTFLRKLCWHFGLVRSDPSSLTLWQVIEWSIFSPQPLSLSTNGLSTCLRLMKRPTGKPCDTFPTKSSPVTIFSRNTRCVAHPAQLPRISNKKTKKYNCI